MKRGHKMTQKHLDAILKARKGYKHSEETRKKIGQAVSIAKKGHKLSKETKKKIGDANRGKPRPWLRGMRCG